MEWISYGLLIVIFLYLLGLSISVVWRKHKQMKEQITELEQSQPSSALTVVGATVTAKEMTEQVTGNPKFPKRQSVFTVVFTTDGGEQKALQVEESVFASLQKGTSGALALLNDRYYDFQAGQNQE